MGMVVEKDNTHIVIKIEDVLKYLEDPEQTALEEMIAKIKRGRENDHKRPVNHYYVCNTDEPYAEVVHGVIMGGESVKNGTVSCSATNDNRFNNDNNPNKSNTKCNANYYVGAEELAKSLNCCTAAAYKFIREMNDELAREGYCVFSGRVPKSYVQKKYYGIDI